MTEDREALPHFAEGVYGHAVPPYADPTPMPEPVTAGSGGPTVTDAQQIARNVLDRIEESNVGKPNPVSHRYTPTFGVDEVRTLAEAYLRIVDREAQQ